MGKKWEGMRKNEGIEKDPDKKKLRKKLKEEINDKKKAYTEKAMKNLGRSKARETYKEVIGEEKDVEELNDNEFKVLEAYKEYNKNTDTTQKLLRHKNEVYSLDENQNWLEENNLAVEELTDFEYNVEEVESKDLNNKVEERKEDIIEEMKELWRDVSGALEDTYTDPESIEDFKELKDEVEMPEGRVERRKYKELFKEKINEYEGTEGQIKGVPDKLKIKVASPLESIKMGNHFNNSCLAVGKINGWSAVANAVDVNKQVLYACNEDDEVVGRVLTGVTKDNELTYFSVYNNSGADIEEPLEEAVKEYGKKLGLDVLPEKKEIETLVAEDWYSNSL